MIDNEYLKCPKCDSRNIRANGDISYRKTEKVFVRQIYCKDCGKYSRIKVNNTDVELLHENVRYQKQKQKFQDTNRIERKAFRENARIENAVEAYASEISQILKSQARELRKINIPELNISITDNVGVIHLTDIHANELIDLPHNKYNFEILAKRLAKLANESIRIFSLYGINTVLIAHTGDALNSDRRLDELLNQAVNRAKASVLLQHILTQFILHIRSYFAVKVVSVLGNESRINKEMSFANNVISDNYDFTIFANLKEKFQFAGIDHIEFGSIDKMEEVVEINGQRWLITHDYNKATNKQNDTQSTIGRYYLSGNPIDFVIGGHIHATRNTDYAARGSSIAGSNTYNEHALNLIGRAGANIFVVNAKNRITINIDVQDVTGVVGYDIINKLKAYNAKSLEKTKKRETVFKVTI
jgi:predicted phosphodiesterase